MTDVCNARTRWRRRTLDDLGIDRPLLQQLTGYDDALDLVRPLVDLSDLRVRIIRSTG